MSDVFTVFGLQRSGTNFLEQLLRNNVKNVAVVNRWQGGDGIWKHAFGVENKPRDAKAIGMKGDPEKGKMIGNRIHAIYIHKHPYSWIQSITDKNVDIKKTYPFVVDRGKYMKGNLNIEKLAELHRDHSRYWLNKVSENRAYHIKYEDLIHNSDKTKEIVQDIAQYFNRKLKGNDISIPEKVGQSSRFTEKDRVKYKSYRITTLNPDEIRVINEILDRDIIAQQGYNLIETQEDYDRHKN